MRQVQRRKIPIPVIISITVLLGMICGTLDCFKAKTHQPSKDWVVLHDCVLTKNASNDGDSFHVNHNGREYIFRLYNVDTPETSSYFKDRVREQAHYFGVSSKEVIELGNQASDAIKVILEKPFTVYTKWQDALGNSKLPRYFAFISTSQDQDLGRLLVGKGLARIHGMGCELPDGTSCSEYKNSLYSVQKVARQTQAGGWTQLE